MADYELIEERLISGKGILKVPSDKTKNRHSVLYLDIVREPKNKYLNKNWNPPKSKYAFLSFIRDDYVIDTASMEFSRQAYDSIADISGQTLIAVKCAYEGILISFVNIATAMGFTLTQYQDLIKDYENLNLGWEEVRIQCYADTAIQARLYRVKYDTCDPTKDNQKKPPPPPPPLPKVPPGTSIGDISQPYDPGTNDDGNTEPYPGDEAPPPQVLGRWRVRAYGLAGGCAPDLSAVYISEYTANTVEWDTRTIQGGGFNGCTYDFLMIDGVSRYPDISGGSASGVGIIERLGDA